jgi:hypothetical protein
MNEIFVPAIGQYDNIGDIVLRRPLLQWLRELGPLHVFVGSGAPQGYVAALGLGPGDRVYRSFGRWYVAGLWAAARGRFNYAFKPGEIQLTWRGLKEHLSMLPLLSLARLRGGRIVRVGSGARNFARGPRLLLMPSVHLAHLVLWRDEETAAFMGQGGAMPDLGFADGDACPRTAGDDRPWLVVSMRGDRLPIPDAWVQAVRALAVRQGLRVRVVTQVARDETLSCQLAERLGAELLGWDGQAHDVQEQRLQQAYRAAAVVVSDRLHVLVAAFTHGAIPVALLVDGSGKIARHFHAAGIGGIDVHLDGRTAEQLADAMETVVNRGPTLFDALAQARARLQDVRSRVAAVLMGASR